MTYDTLYKRTKTGAIVYWDISVVDASQTQNRVTIRKASGQIGTLSPIVHLDTINIGKNIGKSNETTALQQAISQAQSDWTRKKDEGYKELGTIEVKQTSTGPDYIFNGKTYLNQLALYKAIDALLPKYNSDANGMCKPMLAKTVQWDKVTYPCLVQPKLDGVRCLMVVTNGEDVKFLSRSGKDYTTLGHIDNDVAKFLGRQPDAFLSFILDGEIYSDELTFQEVSAAVKKQRPDSLKLKFHAYDIVTENIQDVRALDAMKLVHDISSAFVTWVTTNRVRSREEVKLFHDKWVVEGNEGAMIRLMNGTYAQGQRSSHLLKVKEFDSEEFNFYQWEIGQREEDLIAVLFTESGAKFRAKMIGTREHKEKLRKSSGGDQKMTIKFFGLTADGLPRFPIGVGFRDYE